MGISKIKPLTSQYHSVIGSRGRGLLYLAQQIVWEWFNAYVMKEQCFFLYGSLSVGEAWLFCAGIKQKCRVGVGGSGECRKMARKCLGKWLWNVMTPGIKGNQISSKQCLWIGKSTDKRKPDLISLDSRRHDLSKSLLICLQFCELI